MQAFVLLSIDAMVLFPLLCSIVIVIIIINIMLVGLNSEIRSMTISFTIGHQTMILPEAVYKG